MKPATNSLAKKKYAIPHVYIILLIIILLATVLTYIVPAGQFDRETVDNVKMVIPGTYHRIDQTPVNLFDMFVAIPQGFVSMANIVILIYMCVAGMGILTSTGALERVFGSFISKVGALFGKVGASVHGCQHFCSLAQGTYCHEVRRYEEEQSCGVV